MLQVVRAILLTLPLAGLAGCDDVPDKAPTTVEVAGSYVLADDSARFLVRKMGYATAPNSSLILGSDGTLAVQNIPAVYPLGEVAGRGLVSSGTGTWLVKRSTDGYGVELTIEAGGTMPRAIYSSTSMLLKGHAPPYVIEFLIGDPDSGQSMKFVKNGA